MKNKTPSTAAPLTAASLASLEDERLFALQRRELLGRLFIRLLGEPPPRMARALSHFDLPPPPESAAEAAIDGTRVSSALPLATGWLHLRLRRHEFEIQARPDAPPVPIVTELLAQVIANLLDNAVDAVEERVRSVGTSSERGDEELLGGSVALAHTFSPSGRKQTILVQDDGRGIPPEILTRLFATPLLTTKGASGLGLYVSRRILRAAGGDLNCLRSAKDGSVFEITLPSERRTSLVGSA